MSDHQMKTIIDVLGHSDALLAGDIGHHAGTQSIGKILELCGNISNKAARDIALSIAFGIILGAYDRLATKDANFKRIAEATREHVASDAKVNGC